MTRPLHTHQFDMVGTKMCNAATGYLRRGCCRSFSDVCSYQSRAGKDVVISIQCRCACGKLCLSLDR